MQQSYIIDFCHICTHFEFWLMKTTLLNYTFFHGSKSPRLELFYSLLSLSLSLSVRF